MSETNNLDYKSTVENVQQNGLDYPDRTGEGRRRVFGGFERYDLSGYTLPAETRTQLFLKTLTKEVFGFIKGSNLVKDLGEAFWSKWSPDEESVDRFINEEIVSDWRAQNPDLPEEYADKLRKKLKAVYAERIGSIGPMYGVMWRNFPRMDSSPMDWVTFEAIPSDKITAYKELFAIYIMQAQCPEKNTEEHFKKFALEKFHTTFDQLAKVVHELKTNPYSSRHRVTAFHPDLIGSEKISPSENVIRGKAALAPCHTFFQFMVTDDPNDRSIKKLNCMMYMSSSDVMVGRPYNICQYSLITMMLAHCLGFEPGEFVLVSCDTHIYPDHLENSKKQMQRTPLPFPKVKINPEKRDFFSLTMEDIVIEGYNHHEKIVYKAAV